MACWWPVKNQEFFFACYKYLRSTYSLKFSESINFGYLTGIFPIDFHCCSILIVFSVDRKKGQISLLWCNSYFFCFMLVSYHKNSLDFFITDKFIMRHGIKKKKYCSVYILLFWKEWQICMTIVISFSTLCCWIDIVITIVRNIFATCPNTCRKWGLLSF